MIARRALVLAGLTVAGAWLLLGLFVPILRTSRGGAFVIQLILVILLAIVVVGMGAAAWFTWTDYREERRRGGL